MLDLTFLQDKQILVLGAGLSGMSCVRFLAKHHINFALNDSRSEAVLVDDFNAQYPQATLSVGKWDKALISQADIILVSPGIDCSIDDIAGNISSTAQVFGDVELYFHLKQTPTIAVTGSNGKSTVVSLIEHIGKKLGFKAQLGGNIGVPLLDVIDQDIDYLVLELSSFQLETLTRMNAVSATLLNLCDDHLDRHKTLTNYHQIKQRIYQQCQTAVVNRNDRFSQPKTEIQQISFGEDTPAQGQFGLATIDGALSLQFGEQSLIKASDLPLSGKHNAVNCLAALALGYAAHWPLEEMVNALSSFEGLAHRCQQVTSNDKKVWINDSKATNVGATIAAISGLRTTEHGLVLIAGGQGKGADFTPLTSVLKESVSKLIVLGEDKEAIAAVCPDNVSVYRVDSLAEAVKIADDVTEAGDTILFSPSCASFDMFANYIARGNAFVDLVKEHSSCKA